MANTIYRKYYFQQIISYYLQKNRFFTIGYCAGILYNKNYKGLHYKGYNNHYSKKRDYHESILYGAGKKNRKKYGLIRNTYGSYGSKKSPWDYIGKREKNNRKMRYIKGQGDLWIELDKLIDNTYTLSIMLKDEEKVKDKEIIKNKVLTRLVANYLRKHAVIEKNIVKFDNIMYGELIYTLSKKFKVPHKLLTLIEDKDVVDNFKKIKTKSFNSKKINYFQIAKKITSTDN